MVVLTMVFRLPIASFAAILARRWLAVLPLLVSVALGSAWIACYATDWIGPHSGPAMLWLYVLTRSAAGRFS